MKTYEIQIKCKVGKFEKTVTSSYDEPEDWQEACKMDGSEKKAFSTYLNKRKTNEMDKIRKDEVKAMQEKIIAKMQELGIEL